MYAKIGALESQLKKKKGTLIALSEQMVIDCLSHGCGGGYMEDVFAFFDTNKVVSTQAAYPYTALVGLFN